MTAAAAVLAAAGLAAIGVGLAGQQAAPEPVAAPRAAVAAPADRAVPAPSPEPVQAAPAVRGTVLDESRPVSLTIPAIEVSAPSIIELGLDANRELEVPQEDHLVGWYRGSPTPGELGPAVLAGHVDSAESGPAVFFRLGELRPGDEVLVGREDGTTAVFVVDRVEQHPKDAFPTAAVYGDLDHAGLRLITCGGAFDGATRHYRDNVVVFAHLASVR